MSILDTKADGADIAIAELRAGWHAAALVLHPDVAAVVQDALAVAWDHLEAGAAAPFHEREALAIRAARRLTEAAS